MNKDSELRKFECALRQSLLNASRKNFSRGIIKCPRQVFIILLVLVIPTILFSAPLVHFNDVTATHGINATDPRSLAIGDYDGDGDLDLFFTEDGIASHLFTNNGIGVFTDQAAAAGLALTGLGGDSDSIFSVKRYFLVSFVISSAFSRSSFDSTYIEKLAINSSDKALCKPRVISFDRSLRNFFCLSSSQFSRALSFSSSTRKIAL